MYTLADIATGGAAAIAVSTSLTQVTKKLIELHWTPTDKAHDTLVEVCGLAVSVLVVLVAALSTTTASPFSPSWWHVAVAALIAGVGIKYGSSGLYKALTSGKVDALPALVGELLQAVEPPAPAADTSPPVPAAQLIDPKAIGDQITAVVVAALTPAAFNPPSPPPPPPAAAPVPVMPLPSSGSGGVLIAPPGIFTGSMTGGPPAEVTAAQ